MCIFIFFFKNYYINSGYIKFNYICHTYINWLYYLLCILKKFFRFHACLLGSLILSLSHVSFSFSKQHHAFSHICDWKCFGLLIVCLLRIIHLQFHCKFRVCVCVKLWGLNFLSNAWVSRFIHHKSIKLAWD